MAGDDLNPQREQMAHESMVRNLAAQAEAIWPQERELLARHGLAASLDVLDAGCGTGEFSLRFAREYPGARLTGVDILDEHLERARALCRELGDRVRFEHRSIYELGLPAASFDLTVCRHVLQSIPHADRVLAELVRVTRPGGLLHLIAEDYGMLHFPRRGLDPDEFWHRGPKEFGAGVGTDLHIGRNIYPLLRRLGVREIAIDYIAVDTLRVPRALFATILGAWRDGYAEVVGEATSFTADEFRAHFDEMIATIENPEGYAVWQVPVVSCRVGRP